MSNRGEKNRLGGSSDFLKFAQRYSCISMSSISNRLFSSLRFFVIIYIYDLHLDLSLLYQF